MDKNIWLSLQTIVNFCFSKTNCSFRDATPRNTSMCLSPEIFVSENCNEISNFTKEKHIFAGLGYVVGHLHPTDSPTGEHLVPCMMCHIKGAGI